MRSLYDFEIHIAGIQRSGLHALSNWLIGNFDSVVYRNDAAYDIYKGIYGFELFSKGKKINEYRDPVKAQAFIICHENGTPDILKNYKDNKEYLKSTERAVKQSGIDFFSKKRINYLNLRDPYNNFASAWKLFKNKELLHRLVKIWLDTATEVDTGTLGGSITTVLFNRWVKDIDYRKALISYLSGYNDRNLNMMMGYGGGSSFSSIAYSGKAQEMKLENRWELMYEESFYKDIFEEYPRLKSLSEKIFNFNPF